MEYLLVEPEFPINLGSVARVLMNFGIRHLHIVNPKCKLDDKEVKMFAKKAYSLVQNAKVYDTMDDAINKIKPNLVIGTTGVHDRFRKGIMRKNIPLKDAKAKLERKGKFLIVFGREGTGLNRHESGLCNFFITVPTSNKYPVMNLSHAVAVVGYELEYENVAKKKNKVRNIDKVGNIKYIYNMFNSFVDVLAGKTRLRKSNKIKQSFKNVISRGMPTPTEANSLIAVFNRAKTVIGKEFKDNPGKK